MRKMKVQDAVGQTLCHDMTAITEGGFKGVMFKRGHVIREEDIPALMNIGKNHIYVWEPDADEVHEDDAALALAEAVCGGNLSYEKKPSEGKVSLSAEVNGVFRINRDALKTINRVPDYTVASLPHDMHVTKGQKVCGLRIVPLVTKRENVDQAVAIARGAYPVFEVLPFRPLKCGVVITGSEVYYGRIQDKFEPVMTKKLAGYGAELLGFTKCPDELETILAAVTDFREKGAELILLTGGMSVDPDDLTPTAIRKTGADIITQGVPLQPGNMLMLARLGKTMLVGVPGASMHFKTTSLDVFLPRIFAGVEITKDEIAGYGEGGLCMGCTECRYPICYFGRH
jgi:molybdenum cofactor synthesis domain-containing protein